MPSLMLRIVARVLLLLAGPLAFLSADVVYADDAADLHRAYYLEQAQRDPAAARAVYDRLATGGGDSDTVAAAQRGAARCRDALAAERFAALMPPDVLFYVEARRPAGLVGDLAGLFGLRTADIRPLLDARADADANLPFSLPAKLAISPALLSVLDSFGGVAVGVTSLDGRGEPRGVMVLHHGDAALLKGVLETAMQFAPTARKIAGLPTFRAQNHAVGVLTESLLIVGSTRELVGDVVERLMGRSDASLAAREDLREIYERRAGGTLFALVDGRRALALAREQIRSDHDRAEFEQMNAFLDLEHLRWAAFSLGVRDERLGLDFTVRLDEGHHNMVYNMFRTPAMSRRTLAFVPGDAAAVIGLGVNPPAPRGGVQKDAAAAPLPLAVTGWDIGREVFGNLEEVSAFVMPGGGVRVGGKKGDRIPDFAIVLASGDPQRSRALWDALLSLPAKMMGGQLKPPTDVTIGEATGRRYEIPEFGAMFVVQRDEFLLVGPSKTAISRALRSQRDHKGLVSSPTLKAALDALPAETTLLAILHAGRMAAIGGQMEEGLSGRAPFNIAAEAMERTVVCAGVGESPTEFSVRISVSGLPDANALLSRLAPLFGGQLADARPAAKPQAADSDD